MLCTQSISDRPAARSSISCNLVTKLGLKGTSECACPKLTSKKHLHNQIPQSFGAFFIPKAENLQISKNLKISAKTPFVDLPPATKSIDSIDCRFTPPRSLSGLGVRNRLSPPLFLRALTNSALTAPDLCWRLLATSFADSESPLPGQGHQQNISIQPGRPKQQLH